MYSLTPYLVFLDNNVYIITYKEKGDSVKLITWSGSQAHKFV